jgi:hypothetical protein
VVKRDGIDLETARYFTIMKYMGDGDLRPLADAIMRGHEASLNLFDLAMMIYDGEVVAKGRKVVRRPRGRPKLDGKSVRDQMWAQRYEELRADKLRSDDAFDKVAKPFKMSPHSVRKALTTRRNSEK